MESNPFISIIIPVYNVSEYINDCLQSIVSQDYQGRIECLLVDDCSSDNSADLIRHFIDNYRGNISFSLLFNGSNKGVSAARNAGIKQAKGDYFIFVDSDDTLPMDALSTLAKPLEKERFDVIIGRYKRVGLKESDSPCIACGSVLYGEDVRKHYLTGEWPPTCCNTLIRAELLLSKSLFFYEGIELEDYLWCMEMALEVESVVFIDAFTYYYRIRGGSITTTDSRVNRRGKLNSSIVVLSRIWAAFSAHGLQGDRDAHEFLERSRVGMFAHARYDWSLFKDAYVKLREKMPVDWKECKQMDGFGGYFRDIHLAMPYSSGAVYYFTWWHVRWFFYKVKHILKKHLCN